MRKSFMHREELHKCQASPTTFQSRARKDCPTGLLITHPGIFNLFLDHVADKIRRL